MAWAQDTPIFKKMASRCQFGNGPHVFFCSSARKNRLKLEVHILENQTLPSYMDRKHLKVEFLHYLREERAFAEVAQLKQQIKKDIMRSHQDFF